MMILPLLPDCSWKDSWQLLVQVYAAPALGLMLPPGPSWKNLGKSAVGVAVPGLRHMVASMKFKPKLTDAHLA